MSKHTPGPWGVEHSSFGSVRSASLYNLNGFMASTQIIEVDETRLEDESWLAMRKRTATERQKGYDEAIANIELMAAAPDMLELLKTSCEHLVELSLSYEQDKVTWEQYPTTFQSELREMEELKKDIGKIESLFLKLGEGL